VAWLQGLRRNAYSYRMSGRTSGGDRNGAHRRRSRSRSGSNLLSGYLSETDIGHAEYQRSFFIDTHPPGLVGRGPDGNQSRDAGMFAGRVVLDDGRLWTVPVAFLAFGCQLQLVC